MDNPTSSWDNHMTFGRGALIQIRVGLHYLVDIVLDPSSSLFPRIPHPNMHAHHMYMLVCLHGGYK